MIASKPDSLSSVIYVEPEASTIERFAELACRTLAANLDAAFSNPEVVRGFREVLRIASAIGAQALTEAAQKTVFFGATTAVPSEALGAISERGGAEDEYDLTA